MGYRVIKRDGSIQEFNLENITKQVKLACDGLDCNPDELIISSSVLLRDFIPTHEIQEKLIFSAEQLVDIDRAQWTYVAARLRLYDLYHNLEIMYNQQGPGDVYKKVSIRNYIEKNKDVLNEYINKYTSEELDELNTVIDSSRDLLYDNMGMKTLIDRYLFRRSLVPYSMRDIDNGDVEENIAIEKSNEAINNLVTDETNEDKKETAYKTIVVELPQHMHMLVAMYAAQNEIDKVKWAKIYYEELSTLRMIAATPINANTRSKNGSTASCFVATMDDNIDSIFDTYKEIGLGSSQGGGFGLYINHLRSLGSRIGERSNASNGIVPPMKVTNDIAVYIDQMGKRPGAVNAFLECWHADIFHFIELRKKESNEHRRARELFLSVSFNDLFMERAEEYLNSIEESKLYNTKVKEVKWTLFDPYDVPRLKNKWGNEFREEYLRYEEKYKKHPELFNFNTKTINISELLRTIIISYISEGMPFIYFKDNTNKQHKHPNLGPILSSNLCMEFMNPTSPDEVSVCNLGSLNIARLTDDEQLGKTSEIIVRFLDSMVDNSNYKSNKAKAVQHARRSIGIGILGEAERTAHDRIYIGSTQHVNFINEKYSIIRKHIDKANKELAIEKGSCCIPGLRCAYQMCIAPNTTSGMLAGTTNGVEPVFDKVWVERSKIANLKITAPNISLDNYEFYQTSYKLDQFKLIDMTSERQKYIDMGISHSIFIDPEDMVNNKVQASYILKLIIHAWKKNLKSLYYIRSKQPSGDNKPTQKNKDIKCVGCEN